MSAGPPGWLIRALEAVLPGGIAGRSMVGDLLEEWHRRKEGARRAAWFAGAVAALAARYLAAGAASRAADVGRVVGDAARRAVRRPLQAALSVVALGIGIAAPATMFSIATGLTGELRLEDPDRLVHVGRRFTPSVIGIAPLDWLWPDVGGIDGFESFGVYSRSGMTLSGHGEHARRVYAARVTPGVFEALGTDAALGRTLAPGDLAGDGAPVVLGWDLWRSAFGEDPSILGRTVRLDGTGRTVVGVMPEGFVEPGGADLWVPLDPTDAAASEQANHQAVGRLAAGATLEGVRSRLDALNAALRERGEDVPPARGLAAESWRDNLLSPRDRRLLSVLVVVVGFVLVIACADILNLLLASAISRSRETAVRLALGAGRGRIVGQHLAEAAVLSAVAGVVGLVLTWGAVRLFETQTAGRLAYWMDVRVDVPVLLFAAAMVALAALGTGLVPAVQASRADVAPTLRDGGSRSSGFRIGRFSRALVVGQIALSCALLTLAALMVRGALSDLRTEGGYATSTVLAARYELRPDAYDDAEVGDVHRRLLEALREHPGVAEASITSHLPGFSFAPTRAVEVGGGAAAPPGGPPRIDVVAVAPGFLSVLESGVLRGRAFTWQDGHDAVLVTEAFAREHLPRQDPVGARLRFVRPDETAAEPEDWRTIVGVVPSLGIDVGGHGSGIYVPAAAEPTRRVALLVGATPGTSPLSLASELRERLAGIDGDLALWDVDTLAGHIRRGRAVRSVFAVLFLSFGLAGLLLAAVGLHGVLAFAVRRRTRELGVRTALGASPRRVAGTAVGGGLLQLSLGLAAGVALAAMIAPLLGQALLGTPPHEPVAYAVVATLLALVGILAALAPARHAVRVDVVEALRSG